MKITVGPISLDILLFLRLWWPAAVFIVLCTVILLPFYLFLQLINQIDLRFIEWAWLLLLVCYILLGIAFTRFSARFLHRSFGSEAWRIQRRMVILSGFPFYALCIFLLLTSIYIMLNPALHATEMIGAVLAFSFIGAIGFAIVSCSYVMLTLFFLRRSTVITQ